MKTYERKVSQTSLFLHHYSMRKSPWYSQEGLMDPRTFLGIGEEYVCPLCRKSNPDFWVCPWSGVKRNETQYKGGSQQLQMSCELPLVGVRNWICRNWGRSVACCTDRNTLMICEATRGRLVAVEQNPTRAAIRMLLQERLQNSYLLREI